MATTINDIVPQSVLVKIANRVAQSARGFARKYSKRIPRAIKVGRVTSTQTTASITIWVDTGAAPQALAFERGAKPHIISARNAPFLEFEGTNMFEGELIITPKVSHPGIAKRPYLQPAKDKHRAQNLKEIREAVGKNMRLQIRAMARKV